MNFLMVFDFTQFWLDGRPGNEYFWISHKISGHLTPMAPLGVHPQWFETTWNIYERFLLLCFDVWNFKNLEHLIFQVNFWCHKLTQSFCYSLLSGIPLGLNRTSGPVRKSGRFWKSGLSGNRTFSLPDGTL